MFLFVNYKLSLLNDGKSIDLNLKSKYFSYVEKDGVYQVVLTANTAASGRDRVPLLLKTKGPQTAARMAERLGVTTMAVRQHLAALQEEGLVDYVDEKRKVGRPARVWHLTPQANERFPDRHAEFAVGMLKAVQSTFGEEGLERLIIASTQQQIEAYRARMPAPGTPLKQRVAALAKIRRDEGYMAEWREVRDGTIEFLQNHCAIDSAARFSGMVCGGELLLFRAVLGDGVSVERFEYLHSGDRRCAYRISDLLKYPTPALTVAP